MAQKKEKTTDFSMMDKLIQTFGADASKLEFDSDGDAKENWDPKKGPIIVNVERAKTAPTEPMKKTAGFSEPKQVEKKVQAPKPQPKQEPRPPQKMDLMRIEDTPLVQGDPEIILQRGLKENDEGYFSRKNFNDLLGEMQDTAAQIRNRSQAADKRYVADRNRIDDAISETEYAASQAKRNMRESRDLRLEQIDRQRSRIGQPLPFNELESDFDAKSFQKQLKSQLDELGREPSDVSEMDKMIAALGPALLAVGIGGSSAAHAGQAAFKVGQEDLENIRKRIAENRKNKSDMIGKSIEGTAKLLGAEVERQKMDRQNVKDAAEFERNQENDLNKYIGGLSDSDQAFALNNPKLQADYLKYVTSSGERMSTQGFKDFMTANDQFNDRNAEGIKESSRIAGKARDRDSAELRDALGEQGADGRLQKTQDFQGKENEKNRQHRMKMMIQQEKARAKAAAANGGRPVKLTVGQEAVDRDFAKDYNEYTRGGRASLDKNLARLEKAKEKIRGSKFTSGKMVGALPDFIKPERNITIRQDVQAAAQGALKAALGANFTEKEGERIMAAAYDENLSPEENLKKIDLAIEEILTNRDVMESKVSHFEQRGSLAGYKSNMTAAPRFPRQVRKDGKVAVVSNEQELKEALAEGWK